MKSESGYLFCYVVYVVYVVCIAYFATADSARILTTPQLPAFNTGPLRSPASNPMTTGRLLRNTAL